MAKHSAGPAPDHVGERIKRTALQVGLPAVVLLVVVLPEILRLAETELGDHLPPEFRAWMLASAGLLTAISVLGARIMALPVVNDWLRRFTPFGATPTPEPDETGSGTSSAPPLAAE